VIRGSKYESTGIGKENLPQLQGRPQEGRSAGDLQEPAAQAAPGLIGRTPFWLEN
jgi:hypothetical protein